METLIFAFIAVLRLYNPQEAALAEAAATAAVRSSVASVCLRSNGKIDQPASRSERLASRSSALLIDRLMYQSTNPDSSQNPFSSSPLGN